MVMILPMSMLTLLTCAINSAATASYNAVPSMLIVAPTGMTKLLTRGSTLQLCSKHFSVTGMVAELKARATKHFKIIQMKKENFEDMNLNKIILS
jgi:hypothetical protein